MPDHILHRYPVRERLIADGRVVRAFSHYGPPIAEVCELGGDIRNEAAHWYARLFAASHDYLIMLRAFQLGVARWEADTTELCFGGLRYVCSVDEHGAPSLDGHIRAELVRALQNVEDARNA